MNKRLYQLTHSTWICDYHVVWCSKYRGKVLEPPFIKQELKRMFKYIAKWKGLVIQQWHIGDEHIHLFVSIPPKYSVAYITQVMKGKTSMWLKKKTKKFPKGTLWARGYYVSTIGINEHQIRNYIKNQQHHQVEMPTLF
ncbi:MAG: IS200/IS605 family transposase [Candidatus Paceibacter sp.]|nr:IS200/IS605 family transposase [Candidatus Paceibacter sp.]